MGLFGPRDKREKYMKAALKEAKKAYELGEVPIGCVIVRDGKIIAKGCNRRNTDKSVVKHAEMIAIMQACRKVKDWRLEDCTMYVTLEPCQMCAGAIVQARIPKVVIGCMNPKAGCAGSVINLLQIEKFNHQVEIEKGVLEKECSSILTDFFAELRERKRADKERDQNALEGFDADGSTEAADTFDYDTEAADDAAAADDAEAADIAAAADDAEESLEEELADMDEEETGIDDDDLSFLDDLD